MGNIRELWWLVDLQAFCGLVVIAYAGWLCLRPRSDIESVVRGANGVRESPSPLPVPAILVIAYTGIILRLDLFATMSFHDRRTTGTPYDLWRFWFGEHLGLGSLVVGIMLLNILVTAYLG